MDKWQAVYEFLQSGKYFLRGIEPRQIFQKGDVRRCFFNQRSVNILEIEKDEENYCIQTSAGTKIRTKFLLNASYASTNQILAMAGYEQFRLKYELCEIILCNVNENLKQYGFTVMDGPFFSIMPFGKTGMHSLIIMETR